jgi:hypothetical protein
LAAGREEPFNYYWQPSKYSHADQSAQEIL